MIKRSYKQNCALALSSDLLGERWTLLILRELFIQPCRFKMLNQVLVGMGTNLLSNRLKELERAGLIEKKDKDDKRSHYMLTSLGRTTEPVLLSLIRWGHSYLNGNADFCHRDHWDLLAMKALFQPHKCQYDFVLQFDACEFVGWASISAQGMSIGMGRHEKPDVVVDMNIEQLQQANLEGKFEENKYLKDFALCFDSH